jgi:branched-subunit amino acid transport protein
MQIEASNRELSSRNYLMAGFILSVTALVVWYYKLPLYPTSEEDLPLAIIPFFGFIGLCYLAAALVDSLRLWQFGTSTLEAEQVAALGHRFTGVLTSSKPLDVQASYTVRLLCIETRYYPQLHKRNAYSQITRWRSSYKAQPSAPSGAITVSFDIPADCAATTSPEGGRGQEGVRWVLAVRRRGFSLYYSFFSLKVYRTLPRGHGVHDA